MRKLASIQRIKEINPIEGADRIEVATVNGWDVVVKKDLYEEGEKVVYCEIDSFLPIEPEFEFLRKSSYKKLTNDQEGFRLKSIRMRGQISQGLVIPIEDANKIVKRNGARTDLNLENIGTDVSNLLGIVKYEPPIPAQLSGKMKGYFPSFIRKTDQERIQNLTEDYEELKHDTYFVTEKLDGSSVTFYYVDGEFGVCSRNIELLETEDNSYWRACRNLDIEEKLSSYCEYENKNIALQGELIGNGIQKNPYGLKDIDVRFFSVYDIDGASYWSMEDVEELIITILELEMVPVLRLQYILPNDPKELLQMAEGISILNDTEREGLVFVSNQNPNVSFKAISNKFLL